MERTGLTKRLHQRLCLLGLLILAAGRLAFGATIYVDQAATGTNSGASWAHAYTNLQSALAVAASSDQVWVAEGNYYPTNDSTRSASFLTGAGVALYGGFTNGMTSVGERNWVNYPAVLNGDIQRDGVATNNAYHVMYAADNVMLDGLTICNGFADNGYGGGLVLFSNRNVTVQNCAFTNNAARDGGGAIYIRPYSISSNTVIDNCVFRNNQVTNGSATGGGGAICIFENDVAGAWTNVIRRCRFVRNLVNPASSSSGGGAFNTCAQGATVRWSLSDCYFISNTAYYGGAIRLFWTSTSRYVMSNCLFACNRAALNGGAVYNQAASGSFFDCVFSDNPGGSTVSGAVQGEGFTGKGCVFCGSQLGVSIFTAGTTFILTNCLVVGNPASRYGGVQASSCGKMRLVNCTVAYNGASRTNGGGG